MVQAGVLQAAGDRTLRPQQVRAPHHRNVPRGHRPRHVAAQRPCPENRSAQRPLPRKQVGEREVPFGGRQQRAAGLVGLDRVARGLLRDVALEPARAPREAHEVDVDLRADAQRLAAVGRADEAGEVARGGQRRRHGYCFSRNASFMRTVFCEYIVYFFCAFFCDFLLFLLIVSPFFGILAGRQRAPEVAGRMHAGASVFGAALAACAAI